MSDHAMHAGIVQLHVTHDLGGGSWKWLRDYCAADREGSNLVLKSFTHGAAAGMGLALYASPADAEPLQVWTLAPAIASVAPSHAQYQAILATILERHHVGAVVVSSLIGHSLDALDTGLPTLAVAHDYFPFAAAINLYWWPASAAAAARRLREDPHVHPFAAQDPLAVERVRERYLELVRRPAVTLVAPSQSVVANFHALDVRFQAVRFAVVPHGEARVMPRLPAPPTLTGERLRVLVPGQLSVAKGVDLLRDALPALQLFADVHLVGCRELGEEFKWEPHVHVVSQYEPGELQVHLGHIAPDVALLLSVVPETFSYALSEMFMAGIPPVATRLGSFAERIRDADNGFLVEPDADAVVSLLQRLDADRARLAAVRANLAAWQPRSAGDMVEDYRRLLAAAVARPVPAAQPPAAPAATETLTLADMWKQVRSLSLQLALAQESRIRGDHRLLIAERRFERLRASLQDQLQRQAREMAQRDALIQERDRQALSLAQQVQAQSAFIGELTASTSWRVTAPLRATGRALPKLRVLWRAGLAVAAEPASLPRRLRRLGEAWRAGGWLEVKKAIVGLQEGDRRVDAWAEYRQTLATEVLPGIRHEAAQMASAPRISLVMATYNPPEDMFHQMLEAVRAQIYPHWELCVSDDGSTQPHVRRLLDEYAAADPRIRVRFGEDNRGVAHASNRALEMAEGSHVVLLDHDDVLEEHALFRVAQSIVAEDPDFFYSDEVLVTHDRDEVRRYAFRPGFSLEYLRSHPYIVHLVGFRTELARSIGGFDEGLRISQDYDLILRLVERSRTIVHLPEVLYRWRIHGASAGIARQEQVMAVSRGVLSRHLERCGLEGRVEDGPGFNLFDVRYALPAGLRVAIVIPTRDRADLLKQCIDSVRRTVQGIDYDIVVVDHESDEPATRAYLDSIAAQVRILRHEGPFNFSQINNRAVARIAGPYTHYLFCNNDIEAHEEGWLARMLELAQQPDVGAVGAMLFYGDRTTIQHAGVCVGLFGAAEHYAKTVRFPEEQVDPGYNELLRVNHEVAAVTAACMLMRRDCFEEIGGFDEQIAVGFGDVDLCLKAGLHGFRVVISPHARLIHHESATRGTSTVDPHPADSAYFRVKWKQLLADGDPFYSPSLSAKSTRWAMQRPLPARLEIRRRVWRREEGSGRWRWMR